MSKKKIAIIICIVLLVFIGFLAFKFFSATKTSDAKISGRYFGDQIWGGAITITGDIEILGNLTVLPGTIVKFEVGDDQKKGDEVKKDGFNDYDPTRLKSYTTTHSSLFVLRKLISQGTENKKIVFTSNAQKPYLADWEAIIFQGDGSTLDNVVVEYSRNGLNPIGNQPHSIIKNSIVRHALWGTISTADSSIQIIDNYLADAGHEGIDLAYKAPQVIKGNTIEDCHTGIAVMGGSAVIKNNTIKNCGDGIFVSEDSSPKISNNTIVLAPQESIREWRYDNYVIPIFGNPK